MATKAQVYAKLAEDTARKITASYLDWAAFLNTSSRLYKYPYNDQLLIYAQRPDATACAEYDLWNSAMRRYVRRGAKGIALLSPGANGMSVRYVFDVSDTGARQDSRSVEPWQLSGQVEPSVRQMLEAVFDADAAMGLAVQLEQIASQQALSYWRDHRRDIIDSVDGSFLSEYDEFNIGASFRKAATASISYSLQTRCGLEPELLREDFTEVYDWNTPATVTELGQAVSMITGQVLRQIERTIRQTERSMEHERTDVQAERGLSSARPGPDRSGTAAPGQVRPAQTALPGAKPAGPVHAADAERQADGAPAGDGTDGAEPPVQPDGPAVQASGPYRSVESGEPDGLGQADERPESAGRGDDPLGADLRLTDHAPAVEQLSFLIPSETAQIQWLDTTEAESIPRMPFASLVSQEVIDEFLRSGGNTDELSTEEKVDLAKREQAQQLAELPEPEQPSREEPGGSKYENTQDDEEPIDTEALRSRLAEAGIVNGEVVDEDALNASPFIQEVQALASRMQALEDTTPPDESVAAPDDRQSVDQALPCKVGDTVYLEDTPFVITQIGPFNVQLQDPSLRYPILRSESRENFFRLLARDERNAAYFPEAENAPREGSPQPYPQGFPQNFAEFVDKSVASLVPANFRISDDHLGEGGAKAKFQRNMEAIHLLHRLEAEQRMATPQEQSVLSRYVGWGGLADAFDPEKAAWAREYRELSAALTPQEYEAARASTLNAHYTSPVVIRAMYDAVAQMGFTGGNILEPSMGVGNFFGLLPESMQDSRLYGVELDSITGRIARQLYPKADITVAGFETTDRRDFFDLAIGNVPFGNYKVNDRAYNKLGFSIHNYFFAKTLDQVRPGGVIAFVTSRYTMDQQSPEVRQYIAQRAELLGAIRLPNNAFRANAGTEVVSDILFLQRRDRPIDIEPDWVHVGENADGFTMNSYFIEHPEMVLGVLSRENTQYGRENFTVLPAEGADLADQLHEAIGHIHGVYREASLPDLGEGEALDASIPADPTVRNFSYTVVDGFVYYRENSRMVKPRLNQTAQERVKGLIALRDQVHRLIDAQLDEQGDEEIAQLQRELNTLYDGFSVRFGLINDRANRLAFAEDSSYYLLCSLEILDDEHRLLRKADMFTRRTIRQQHRVDHVDTASDALAVSIGERARVDLGFMAGLTGKSEEEIVQELSGVIFRIPGTEQYVTADEYLSGNVRQKLRDARAAAQADAAFGVNVSALEAAQPKDLEASDIDVRLGATWISQEYVQDFMYDLLETPYYQRRVIEVHFSAHTAEWRINGKHVVSRTNVAAYTTYGTDRANACKILEDTLNLRDVRIYDTIQDADGREQRVLNQKATTLAQQKQQAIKDAFREWIWKDPDRRQALVAQYNELFNSVRPREYDGRHIVFSGMNPEISLREHQRNAVAHILYGGNTLLAHQVGAGKTFEMVAAAMESKRLGLCQKSMFVVPNHLTEQWASAVSICAHSGHDQERL